MTAALLVLVRLAVPAPDFAKEYAKADGTWHVTAMAMNGEDIAPEGVKGLRMVLKGTSVKAYSGDDVIAEGTYKVVGVAGKLVRFDLTMSVGPDKGKTFPALNEWTGPDAIRTCLAQPGKPRPTSTATEAGDRRAVFVIERKKK